MKVNDNSKCNVLTNTKNVLNNQNSILLSTSILAGHWGFPRLMKP